MAAETDNATAQAQAPLLQALQAQAQRSDAAFYTPGHKRGQGSPAALARLLGMAALRSDLPELPELDDLFAPSGPIAEAQALAAAAFGADRSWFLVNGSSCGMAAAMLAACDPGDKIVLPRNSHQSAISGAIASGAMPVFVEPACEPSAGLAAGVAPAAIDAALAHHPDARAVLVVRPTYQGFCNDLAAIADRVHRDGIPLLVDEAHGAHLAFHPELPQSALAAGADLVVQSSHKTLGALTQAAMLHCQGARIDTERIASALQLLQSSSPNYALLASLDAARQQMALEGHARMTQTLALAKRARDRIPHQAGLPVLGLTPSHRSGGASALDPTRLTVDVSPAGLSGFAADGLLRDRLGVTAECPLPHHLTFALSLGNAASDTDCLIRSLAILSEQFGCSQASAAFALGERPPSDLSRSPREAFFAPSQSLPLERAAGEVSAESVCPYPPGIPVLVPGEAIAPATVAYLQQLRRLGVRITGCRDPHLRALRVVRAP